MFLSIDNIDFGSWFFFDSDTLYNKQKISHVITEEFKKQLMILNWEIQKYVI